MWFALAVLSALLFGIAGLLMKVSQMRKGSLDHLLFGLYLTGSAGFLLNCIGEKALVLNDGRLWLAGLIVGTGTAWGNFVFMKALDYGPASLTSPLTNMNIVFIVVLSVAVYGETVNWTQIGGIILLLGAVMLISVRGKEPLSITEKRWFVYIAASIVLFTFRNGGLKVTDELGLPNTPILFIAYLLSLAWFAWILVRKAPPSADAGRTGGGRGISPDRRFARTGLRWGLLAGGFSYAGLKLYSLAIGLGPANIVAPIFATNSLVIALGSIWLYKEKLGRRQIAAVCLLFAGLVLTRV